MRYAVDTLPPGAQAYYDQFNMTEDADDTLPPGAQAYDQFSST